MVNNNQAPQNQEPEQPTFIDLYAGCGGLSLGLMQAGWRGLFAVEKSPMAFETLRYNLVDQEDGWRFDWPREWFPVEPIDIETFIEEYSERLEELKGITLLAGGLPCQGYSRAGKRKPDDERNHLVDHYLQLIDLLEPKMLLIENVSAFAAPFDKTERGANGTEIEDDEHFNADKQLKQELCKRHYVPHARSTIMAKSFGVPQLRPRYILIGIREDLLGGTPGTPGTSKLDPFQVLNDLRGQFLSAHSLPTSKEVTLEEAISDLLKEHGHVSCKEPQMKRFRQGKFGPIKSKYQELMRKSRDGKVLKQETVADSHRFPNHKPTTIKRFERIISDFRPGIQLREEELSSLGLNKHRIAPLAPNEACHTLTSLPDDLVHYCEPRVPTVREYARIQSFPDWFEFKSNYTTGGKRRRVEVPRYTQAANAVPPLLAEAIGQTLIKVYKELLDMAQQGNVIQPTYDPQQLELQLNR